MTTNHSGGKGVSCVSFTGFLYARNKLRSHRSQLLGVLKRPSSLIDHSIASRDRSCNFCECWTTTCDTSCDHMRAFVRLCDLTCTFVPQLYVVTRLVDISISRATPYDGRTNPLNCDHPRWKRSWPVVSEFWTLKKNQPRPVWEHFHSQDYLQQVRSIVRSSWDHLLNRQNVGRSLSLTDLNAYVTGP